MSGRVTMESALKSHRTRARVRWNSRYVTNRILETYRSYRERNANPSCGWGPGLQLVSESLRLCAELQPSDVPELLAAIQGTFFDLAEANYPFASTCLSLSLERCLFSKHLSLDEGRGSSLRRARVRSRSRFAVRRLTVVLLRRRHHRCRGPRRVPAAGVASRQRPMTISLRILVGF